MFLLNRTGVMAFRLYQHGCPSSEITRRLTRQFSVPTERVAVDIRDFFTQARAYGVSIDR
jgi:hypothetical protein